MKRQLFILLIGGLIGSGGLMAQKVYKSGIGATAMIILDTTVAAGMPLGGQTNEHKYVGIYTTSNVTNTDYVEGSLQASLDANDAPYEKLAIALQDVSSPTTIPTTLGAPANMTWRDAFLRCKGLTHAGLDDWRLPTARELALMFTFRSVLDILGAPMTGAWYNSATESEPHMMYGLDFTTGNLTKYSKNMNRGPARCVREL